MKKRLLLFLIFISSLTFAQKKLLPIKVEHKWGCIDYNGNVVISPEYDFIGDFSNGIATAQKNGKVGIIDTSGKVVMDFKYPANYSIELLEGFLLISDKGKKGLNDIKGNTILETKYRDVELLQKNKAGFPSFILFGQNYKQGILNAKGEIISKPKFSKVKYLETNDNRIFLKVKIATSWGLLDLQGNLKIKVGYEELRHLYNNWFIIKVEDKKGIYDIRRQKEILAPENYTDIGFLNDEHILVYKNNKIGLFSMRENKEILTPNTYDNITKLNKNYVLVYKKNKANLYSLLQQKVVINEGFSNITSLDERFLLIHSVAGVGVYDSQTEKRLISSQYKGIELLENQSFLVQDDEGKLGLYDSKGKKILDNEFQQIIPSENNSIFILNKDGRWGMANQAGKIIIPFQFQKISKFRGNVARVQKGDLYGLINTQGFFLAQPQYKVIFLSKGTAKLVSLDNKNTFLKFDLNGNLLESFQAKEVKSIKVRNKKEVKEESWDDIDDYSTRNNNFIANTPQINNLEWFSKKVNKGETIYGLRRSNGEVLIKPRFNNISHFDSLGYAVVTVGTSSLSKEGIVDSTGKIVLEPEIYDKVVALNTQEDNKALFKAEISGKWGIIKADNEVLLPLLYDSFDLEEHTENSFIILRNPEEQWGYIDEKGRPKIPAMFLEAFPFIKQRAIVSFQGKWGFINEHGNFVGKAIYEQVRKFSEGMAAVKRDDRWGFINKQGKEIIKPQFFEVGKFENGVTWAMSYKSKEKTKKQYFFIDKTGKVLNPEPYEDISNFDRGISIEKGDKAQKYGIKNVSGNWLIKPTYKLIRAFSKQGFALYKKRGKKYGLLNMQGKEVCKPRYYSIGSFIEGMARVKLKRKGNRKFGFINKQGKLITPKGYRQTRYFSEGVAAVKLIKVPKKLRHIYLYNSHTEAEIRPKANRIPELYTQTGELVKMTHKNIKKRIVKYTSSARNYKKTFARFLNQKKDYNDKGGYRVFQKKDTVSLYRKSIIFNKPELNYIYGSYRIGYRYDSLANKKIRIADYVALPAEAYVKISMKNVNGNTKRIKIHNSAYLLFSYKTHKKIVKSKYDYAQKKKIMIFQANVPTEVSRLHRIRKLPKFKNLWAYIDSSGKMILPPLFKSAYNFKNNVSKGSAWISGQKVWFYFDKQGKVFLSDDKANLYADTMLKKADELPENLEIYSNQSRNKNLLRYGVKYQQKVIIPPSIQRFSTFAENRNAFAIKNLQGVISVSGKELLPIEYQKVEYMEEGIFKVQLYDKIGYWSFTKKEWLWELQN